MCLTGPGFDHNSTHMHMQNTHTHKHARVHTHTEWEKTDALVTAVFWGINI